MLSPVSTAQDMCVRQVALCDEGDA